MKQLTLRHLANQYKVYEGSRERPMKKISCAAVKVFVHHQYITNYGG